MNPLCDVQDLGDDLVGLGRDLVEELDPRPLFQTARDHEFDKDGYFDEASYFDDDDEFEEDE